MFIEKSNPILEEFVGKYLIPTDTIRHQSMEGVKHYISEMQNGEPVPHIYVTTDPISRVGEVALVSDLIKENIPIFILDGHHRFIATLSPLVKDYPLKALFVDRLPNYNRLEAYYDYQDAYHYWEKYEG